MSGRQNQTPRFRVFRSLIVLVGSLGLLGAAAQARANVALERRSLEARVDAVRGALPVLVEQAPADERLAQWKNWANWNNWNNFRNVRK